MQKLTQILSVLTIFLFSQKSPAADLDGQMPYYEINVENIKNFETALEDYKRTSTRKIPNHFPGSRMETLDAKSMNIPMESLYDLYADFPLEKKPDFKAIQAATSSHHENEKNAIILSLLTHEQGDIFSKFLESAEEKRRLAIDILGNVDLIPIKLWIDRFILQMPWSLKSPSLPDFFKPLSDDQRETIFQIMKETDFLKTNIETVLGYSYSQAFAAKAFLENNPGVHTLVLGCGCSIPKCIQGYGATCQEIHHVSKGEMTASIPDQYSQYENVSDVIGDVNSPHFWEGIRQGLAGRKFSTIKDHSYYPISTAFVVMDSIRSVLQEGGVLEIVIHDSSVEKITAVFKKYFELVSLEPWISFDGRQVRHGAGTFRGNTSPGSLMSKAILRRK